MNHLQHCAALEQEVDRFADTLDAVPGDLAVPACPGWSATDLGGHLGTIHRWAEALVRRRAPERIPAGSLDLDDGPVSPDWIREGGRRLTETLRRADPDDPMWAWGADQHVRFWSRRQLHETLVHRLDLQQAGGHELRADPALAEDAVDELLVNLADAEAFSPWVSALRGDGERLGLRSTGSGRTWTVTLLPGGFAVAAGAGGAGVELAGPALQLLLVLYRRSAPGDADVTCTGNGALVDFWLEHSALG